MKLTKILVGILAFVAISAYAATPKKIGPVSYYGALHTSGNKIIGAKNNQQAMLRGLSLYWSDATGMAYYDRNVISWAVDNLKIDMFRYAMGIEYYDSNGGTKNKIDDAYSYKAASDYQLAVIDKMVEAAIENDVYIIIDWHSHRAHLETSLANTFFETVSTKYKDVPNIIYEIYDEPVSGSGGDWSAIKNYANTVASTIRANTQNLIIVGTPNWSQHPEQGARDPVNATNIAYVLHFYASTHSRDSYGGNVSSALSAGYPVFISEWGSTNADADGEPNSSATSKWTAFMDENLIPNCNWSLRQLTSHIDQKSEKSAIFAGDKPLITVAALNAATFTSSGNIVKSYLTKNARSWADSLVKDKQGDCAIEPLTAKQTDGKIVGKLVEGCKYASSDESVVSVDGNDIVIHDYGFAILTAGDSSQSVVTILQVAGQTIPNLQDVTCNYSGNCKVGEENSKSYDLDGDGVLDYLLTKEDITNEGAEFTLASLDTNVVSVSKSNCSSAVHCPSDFTGKNVWMLHFNGYGTAKIVATAPAIPDYRAMQDTFEIVYKKGNALITKEFMDQKVELGGTSTVGLPDSALTGAAITYTYNGKESSPYLTKDGEGFVADTVPAIVAVTATVPETENYAEFTKTVLFIIGDSANAVNKKEYETYLACLQGNCALDDTTKIDTTATDTAQTDTTHADTTESISVMRHVNFANVRVERKTLVFKTAAAGPVQVDIFDALGSHVKQRIIHCGAGEHAVNLDGMVQGSYVLVVRQGLQKSVVRWVNR